uniref:Uncharacterized protein n=1 Tax=viral metagenome TaxID=1070528 RepID=A0A6H1ZZL5_9ZZZZ
MIGLIKMVLNYNFLLGLIVGAGGLTIYLITTGTQIKWNKGKK